MLLLMLVFAPDKNEKTERYLVLSEGNRGDGFFCENKEEGQGLL